MLKRGLLVVVALLAMASMMAAMAFSSAAVANAAELKVVNTSGALLGLHASTNTGGNAAGAARIVDGVMVFDFSRGADHNGSGSFGLQRNSTYEWGRLFNIRNNSGEAIKVKIDVEGDIGQYMTIMYDHSTYKTVLFQNGQSTGYVDFPLINHNIKVIIDVPGNATIKNYSGTVTVSGQSVKQP